MNERACVRCLARHEDVVVQMDRQGDADQHEEDRQRDPNPWQAPVARPGAAPACAIRRLGRLRGAGHRLLHVWFSRRGRLMVSRRPVPRGCWTPVQQRAHLPIATATAACTKPMCARLG